MARPPLRFLPFVAAAVAAAPSPALAGPKADGLPVTAEVPWVRYANSAAGRTLVEEIYDVDLDPADMPPAIRQGDMVFGPESFARDILDALDLPLPGLNQDPTPGVLVLEMNGVTLRPYCGNGESANGALNCSPLVDQETVFPSVGNQAAILQKVRGYMQDFGLVVSGNRPPPYLPYTLAVIGGSASNAGYGGGTCGIANVACDGLKRNHVSLTFTSCGSSLIPDIVAQETSHNWGLEHTNNPTDLLYPTANGGAKTYVDSCMNIVSNNGPIQCDYVHEHYCPQGGGSQQNSYQEMLGVFGPAYTDTSPPQIVSITPADGSTFSPDDSFTVSANVDEDTNFVGVRWTWTEGVPEEIANSEGTYTKCTNKVCDDDFGVFLDPNETNWDFLTIGPGAPAGTYSFTFEVMDAFGQSDMQTITVQVVGGGTSGGDTSGGDTSGGDTSGGGTSGGGTTTGGTDGSASAGGTSGGSDTTAATGSTTAGGEDEGDGCGCATPGHHPGRATWLAFATLLGLRRRRR